MDKWELQKKDFELECKIGSGNFGTVFKGILNLTADSKMVKSYKDHMMLQGNPVHVVAVKELKGVYIDTTHSQSHSVYIRICVCFSMYRIYHNMVYIDTAH